MMLFGKKKVEKEENQDEIRYSEVLDQLANEDPIFHDVPEDDSNTDDADEAYND
ncbi:MAG: hypothetical protein PUC66_02865 [Erysipelotrichaceae bacterium]|nr:hypothetical protein [Erysipelotrichaceae bacterium]